MEIVGGLEDRLEVLEGRREEQLQLVDVHMRFERSHRDPEDRDHHHGGDQDDEGIADAGVSKLLLLV